jgi:hypothetical protein
MLAQVDNDFRGEAPLSAAEAAITVLDGVRAGGRRILVGEDAKMIEAAARQPEAADDYAELSTPRRNSQRRKHLNVSRTDREASWEHWEAGGTHASEPFPRRISTVV